MDTDLQPRRMHPLVAAAAGSIVVVSLVGVAAITGVLPLASSSSGPTYGQPMTAEQQEQQSQQAAQTAAATSPSTSPNVAPNASPNASQYALTQAPAQPQSPPQSYAQQPAPQQPAATCSTCGTVSSVQPIRTEGHGTGLGAVAGGVAGGLLGNQFGHGGGRAAMTVVGALGGGYAGNAIEKNVRSSTVYRVYVRMDTGKTRYYTYEQAPGMNVGDRVHLENGGLVRG